MRAPDFDQSDRMPIQPAAGALGWSLFETMLLMRRFEEAVALLAQQGAFSGHYHLYIGQEATGAGAMAALEARDHVVTTHRNHGHIVARGELVGTYQKGGSTRAMPARPYVK